MTYAIITVGGKQYRVSEGEKLLVDRVGLPEGETFTPTVLLVGGDGAPDLAPAAGAVTAKVLGDQRGPKIRIGKYKQRVGYRRHTGFRAALTQIEIASIGAGKKSRAAKTEEAAPAAEAPSGLPAGYVDLTVAQIKEQAGSWDAAEAEAALAYEQSHGQRKGAIAALEAALDTEEAS